MIDHIGRWASLGCGLHCAAMTIVSLALPGLWLSPSWLGLSISTWVVIEKIFVSATVAAAAISVIVGYIRGNGWFGIALLVASASTLVGVVTHDFHRRPFWGSVAVLICAIAIALGHSLQIRAGSGAHSGCATSNAKTEGRK